MHAAVLLVALIVSVGIVIRSLKIVFRYLSNADYAARQTLHTNMFVLLPALATILGGVVFLYDSYAWYRDFHMAVKPIERIDSFLKTGLFFGITVLSSSASWWIFRRAEEARFIPNAFAVMALSIGATLSSLFWIFFSAVGYCCETTSAVFSGFPLSMVHGDYGIDYAFYHSLKELSFLQIVMTYGNQLQWSLDLFALLVNFLFWCSVVILGYSFVALLTLGKPARLIPDRQ